MKIYEELPVDWLEGFAGFDKKAMCILAEKYENGDNVEQNLNKAIELYQRAADNNYAIGMYKLGNIYFDGRGVEQNHETALRLYKRAGARNHVLAMAQVGKCYHHGYGTEKDDRKAVEWLRNALAVDCSKASIEIMKLLGDVYADKSSNVFSEEKVIDCYTKAALQGNEDAKVAWALIEIEKEMDNFIDWEL